VFIDLTFYFFLFAGQTAPRGPYEDMDNSRSQAAPVVPQGTGGSADKTYYNIG
jgi:hypothetical protein